MKLDTERWYPLTRHDVQDSLMSDNVRFPVVPAGRRSGKTEKLKRKVAIEAMRKPGLYFLGAPTRPQVKKIYWDDMKALTFAKHFGKDATSETELKIMLPNGSEIHLVGLDSPQRFEGIPWDGGGIDEIADMKPHALNAHIMPALNTYNPTKPDHRAWCWFIGVPDGLNHYYDLAQYALHSGDPDWKLYTWHSADILPPDMIEAERNRMSAKQFAQEYEASFETATGKIYEDYARENTTDGVIEEHEQLLWMHDFNYTPMSSAVGVKRDGALHLLDEIILTSAVARQTALEFTDKYKDHKNKHVMLYGDPAGKAGEKHGHASDYVEIETVLRAEGWKVTRQVKAAAPAIRDRQNAVRAKICNAAGHRSLFINPLLAPYCHKGLATVQTKGGSTFLEDETEYQHITTAIGYCVDYIWPTNYIRREQTHVTPQPQRNHW